MKILAVAPVLTVAVLLIFLPFTFAEVDRYTVKIEERGTRFSEEIDVDEKRDAEVFRVPSHNDVDGADFYHDFKMRVTVTKILSRKACYISEIDSSLPSPRKLKEDLERATLQAGKLRVTTNSDLVVVTGPANRLLLTKEILNFCGALPIYHTELSPWNSTQREFDPSNGTATIRQRRQTGKSGITKFAICCGSPTLFVERCLDADWNLRCKMSTHVCYYLVRCIQKNNSWYCDKRHQLKVIMQCCDFICP